MGLVRDWTLILLSVMYVLAAGITVVYTVRTTLSDPTDPTVARERASRKLPEAERKKAFNKGDYEYFCSVCMAHVIQDSKHCRKCNRCTQLFDHHCNIVNNDIGIRNYRLFAVMIGAANVFLTLHLGLSAYSLALLYRSASAPTLAHLADIQTQWATSLDLQIGLVSSFTGVILCFLGMLPLGHLSIFHLYLCHKGMTTF